MKDIIAIVLAAGNGSRAGGKLKQFFTVAGRPLLHYSVDILQNCEDIGAVIIVVPKNKVAYAKRKFASANVRILAGGSTRRESCFIALEMLKRDNTHPSIVVIHDAVRPLFTLKDVKDLVQAARTHGGAMLGSPATDTIVSVGRGFVTAIPDRNSLYVTYTPHAYQFSKLYRAHTDPINRASRLTYDENSALMRNAGFPVKLVVGSYPNLKLTYAQDTVSIAAYLKARHE